MRPWQQGAQSVGRIAERDRIAAARLAASVGIGFEDLGLSGVGVGTGSPGFEDAGFDSNGRAQACQPCAVSQRAHGGPQRAHGGRGVRELSANASAAATHPSLTGAGMSSGSAPTRQVGHGRRRVANPSAANTVPPAGGGGSFGGGGGGGSRPGCIDLSLTSQEAGGSGEVTPVPVAAAERNTASRIGRIRSGEPRRGAQGRGLVTDDPAPTLTVGGRSALAASSGPDPLDITARGLAAGAVIGRSGLCSALRRSPANPSEGTATERRFDRSAPTGRSASSSGGAFTSELPLPAEALLAPNQAVQVTGTRVAGSQLHQG